MRMPLKNFQRGPTRELREQLERPGSITVLAGCVGSGKTLMLCHALRGTVQRGRRVLIYAENQTQLRGQWARELREFYKGRVLEVGETHTSTTTMYDPAAQIVLAIPSSLHRQSDLAQYDVIVYDEGHRYALEMMHTALREKTKKHTTRIVYASATPHRLRKDVDVSRHAKWIVLGMDEIQRQDAKMIQFPETLIVPVYARVRRQDYNEDNELKSQTATLSRKETFAAVRFVSRRVKKSARILWQAHNAQYQHHDIRDAIHKYFPGQETRISVSATDGAGVHLREFQQSSAIKHCIVVGRGVLGFNMPELTVLVDLSCSLNPETRTQRYGRITRYHRGWSKQFFVFTAKSCHNDSVIAQYMAYDLCTSTGLENYHKGFQSHTIFKAKERKPKTGRPAERLVARKPILPSDPIDLLRAREQFEQTGKDVRIGGVTCVAMTASEVAKAIGRERAPKDVDGHIRLIRAYVEQHEHAPSQSTRLGAIYSNYKRRNWLPLDLGVVLSSGRARQLKTVRAAWAMWGPKGRRPTQAEPFGRFIASGVANSLWWTTHPEGERLVSLPPKGHLIDRHKHPRSIKAQQKLPDVITRAKQLGKIASCDCTFVHNLEKNSRRALPSPLGQEALKYPFPREYKRGLRYPVTRPALDHKAAA